MAPENLGTVCDQGDTVFGNFPLETRTGVGMEYQVVNSGKVSRCFIDGIGMGWLMQESRSAIKDFSNTKDFYKTIYD